MFSKIVFPFSRRGTFYGGIFLPAAKAATEDQAIRTLPLAEFLHVPVAMGAEIIAQRGQSVQAGECLARSPRPGESSFSPAAGVVSGLAAVDTAHVQGGRAVEIRVDEPGIDSCSAAVALSGRWPQPADGDVQQALSRCGPVSADQDGASAAAIIEQARRRGAHTLILNGMESEPCLTAEYRILVEHGQILAQAAECLRAYLALQQVYLAIDRAKKDLRRTLERLCRGSAIQVAGLHNRFPVGCGPLLVQALVGQEVPIGQQPIDLGIVVLSARALLHVALALADATPPTATVLTVSGDAVQRPGNYWVSNGTSVAHVLRCVGVRQPPDRLIAGGPMTGKALSHDGAVLTLRCPALLAMTARSVDHAPASACVHCGWCQEVCPMRLDPAALLASIELQQHHKTAALHVQACIGCGLCSYVCPSSLPLTHAVVSARQQTINGCSIVDDSTAQSDAESAAPLA